MRITTTCIVFNALVTLLPRRNNSIFKARSSNPTCRTIEILSVPVFGGLEA
ncbi:uncharacterized protein PHALS_04708 [Plasmopara halstedii]|uniref:Uncharacterized protein n=1 Tax=Plasmopara halstedii TaxID=4781 RepID=A0A0P1A988_PLAHL|nr:uncharacterized protein PHALS_04708 [Plasmopara halstedii]CEG37269.1 hypothetical protein PHALS_04708 [Plasmopara halstedii]|eukprot:XP_024573638.1 hypothetical protein PHALS_04708 [Plasmopara halstedii]